jgi:PAS domain S-box-containing protein
MNTRSIVKKNFIAGDDQSLLATGQQDAPRLAAEVPPSRSGDGSSQSEFHRLLEKLPAAAYTCDREGLITFCNQRAVDLWGREPVLHSPLERWCGSFRLLTPEGIPLRHEQCWMARAILEGRDYNGQEIVVERPDGSRRAALAHANSWRDAGDRVVGGVNVLVDVTDQRQTELLLREVDRRNDAFLAMLAHELRNPLAPISTGLELMKQSLGEAEALAEIHAVMQQQLAQIVRLVDDLLDVSRIATGKIRLRKSIVELSSIVERAVSSVRPVISDAEHQVSVTVEEGVTLLADAARVVQIVFNLLDNAAKYTQPGGRITLTARREGNEAVIAVADTGMGIPSDKLRDVFDLFTQLPDNVHVSSGLGVGLTLVKRLAELHDGSVEATSRGPGQGSEFVVRLPLHAAARPDQSGHAPAEEPARRGTNAACALRVLVVDDNRSAAKMLGMLIRAWGGDARVAHDGAEALEVAEQFQPEVALLDLGMPTINGYDVARRLRDEPWGERMVLIAITGWSQEEHKRLAREAGFDHHLAKPVDPDLLRELLTGHAPQGRQSAWNE